MSARQIAIGKALQELEPAVLDVSRMSHLVARHAEDWVGGAAEGWVKIPVRDAEALLFGVYNLDARIQELREAYDDAFKQAPDG